MRNRQKTKAVMVLALLGGLALGAVRMSLNNEASALTYRNDTDLTFTFNPVITLAVSGDLSIDDLAPNTASDSNIITITAGSNAIVGYTLYTNVGDTTNNYTDLRLATTDSTNKFSVLSSPVSTIDNMGESKWGYSYCNNAGDCTSSDNWVYGSAGSVNTGYGIMPLYNDATHSGDIKLADTTNADETTVNFKIGAKASDVQAAGVYTNVINFINIPKIVTIDYTLNYVDRSGTATDMPAATTGTTTDGTFKLSMQKPTNTNADLVFRAWCTADNSADSTTCPSPGSTIYPGNLYAIGSTNPTWSGSVYAVWQDNSEPSNGLYDVIASMSKGKQTVADLQTAITVPTSIDRTEDTSNSGVYEYDPSVFGTASDASNDYTIYYYRGVLENTVGTYGSDGSAVTYPNYVVLSSASDKSGLATTDTCWRIVRTTGSGGVKMIYNGLWTGSTCANATTTAQLTTQAFGLKGNSAQSYWYRNINRVGYTFNNDSSIQDSTTATSVDTVFGSDANPSLNNARSNIKTYIEDTWYASNMTNYTGILESSAGYCNDRTAYSNAQLNPTALSTIAPYKTSSATMYFGARERVAVAGASPSLTCTRSTVDLYHYVQNSTGVSNELKYPTALITADEAALAGSGYSASTTPYHANSFLRSGSYFWLLSPYYRSSNGGASGFTLDSDGSLSDYRVTGTFWVRPAISLTSGTSAVSGTGVADDPWIVNAP